MRSRNRFVFTLLALAILCTLSFGQTNWAVEGGLPTFGEFNAPPPACMPQPVPYSVFPNPLPTPGCPPLFPFPFTIDYGGTAFDNDGNSLSGGTAFPAMLHSDGKVVEMVDAATGAYINSWVVGGVLFPGAVTGLGYDSTGDIIWVMDGNTCMGLGLSPSCTAPPPILVGPFPLPLITGVIATGLDWDPCTGTLWFCDAGGAVVNCTTAGVLISFFLVSPPMSNLLMGLTVDTAVAVSPHIQVTDGALVAQYTTTGALVPAGSFYYLSSNPYPIPAFGASKVSGLGFSLKPNFYGRGCPGPSGVTPIIGFAGGYPFVGNGGFRVTMTNAWPGASSYLIANVTPACPPLNLLGCVGAIWVAPPWPVLLPLGPVPATGNLTVPVPIPPSPGPCGPYVGAPIYCQFINVISLGPTVLEITDAMTFTIGDA